MERINCCILGCRRTIAHDPAYNEWICGRHWSLANKKLRTRFHRAKRRWRRHGQRHDFERHKVLWNLLKDQAQARAVGL